MKKPAAAELMAKYIDTNYPATHRRPINTAVLVRQFHETFNHPHPTTPEFGDEKRQVLRLRLIADELCEMATALGYAMRIHSDPLAPKDTHECTLTRIPAAPQNMVQLADGLGDLDYVVAGGFVAFGIPAAEVTAEVHISNLTKLDENGFPLLREDGKVMKSTEYQAPDLAPILEKSGWQELAVQ